MITDWNAYHRRYRREHPEVQRKATAKWKAKNPDYFNKYAKKNRIKIRTRQNAWNKANRDKVRLTERRHRLKNINRRLRTNLSRRIRRALNGSVKRFKSLDYAGCDISYLKKHLELLFRDGMTWDNYGKIWHVDHVIPCLKFDLTKIEQQRRCFHFSNLQPLFADENISKRARCDVPQLHLL